jgi:5-methylcytosine-specific restriction endonuclease McrA
MRYPLLSAYVNERTADGKLCRNCSNLIPKGFRHYCSHKCRREFQRNHTWDMVREDVLARDGYRCTICRGRRNLQVDHMIPLQMGANPFDKKNLRTLCKECHKAKTKMENRVIKDI